MGTATGTLRLCHYDGHFEELSSGLECNDVRGGNRAAGQRRMSIEQFNQALEHMAQRKNLPLTVIQSAIADCQGRVISECAMRRGYRRPPLFVALSLFAVACMLTSTANLWYCHGSCSLWRSNQNRSGRATFPERFWKVNQHTLLRLN